MPRRKYPNFSWAGAAVLIIATCLAVGWATALVFSASSRTPPINDTTKDLLSSIGGVLAGAVTAYIGGYVSSMRSRNRRRHRDEDDDDADDDEDDDDPAA